jgi:hypothetical protein
VTTAAAAASATSAVRPQFGADGALFFMSDRGGAMQLWSRSRAGTESQLSPVDRVGAYALSPDRRFIVSGADAGGDERWSRYTVPVTGGEASAVSPVPQRVHHLVGWSPDGAEVFAFANLRDARFFDLMAFPIQSGLPRVVLQQTARA